MTKKITISVSDETYNRWKLAAKEDQRSLSVWVSRRVEGLDSIPPQLPASQPQLPASQPQLPASEQKLPAEFKARNLIAPTPEPAAEPDIEPMVNRPNTILERLKAKQLAESKEK